jgi:hypothetical protein
VYEWLTLLCGYFAARVEEILVVILVGKLSGLRSRSGHDCEEASTCSCRESNPGRQAVLLDALLNQATYMTIYVTESRATFHITTKDRLGHFSSAAVNPLNK